MGRPCRDVTNIGYVRAHGTSRKQLLAFTPTMDRNIVLKSNFGHRSLFLEEVLLRIFGYLRELGYASLANAARTCKTWNDVASMVLWKTAYIYDLPTYDVSVSMITIIDTRAF